MANAGQIERQSASYRQGLVLGLTMAEIMLLLVFCLLLAAGASLRHERMGRERAELEAKHEQMGRERAELEAKHERMGRERVELEVAGLKDGVWNGRTERERVERELAVLRDSLARERAAREQAEKEAVTVTGRLRTEHEARENAERDYTSIKDAAPIVKALMENAPLESTITDMWKEIVESRDVVRELEGAGVSPSEAKDNAKLIAAVMEQRRQGADAEALKRDAELAKGVERVEKANGIQAADVNRTLEALDKGLKAGVKGEDPSGHKWPPMISLSEAGGYFFKLGSAELDQTFEKRLRDDIVPILLKTAKDFDVNVIEVVGHTDELPIGLKSSNLDREMIEVMRGAKPIGALRPGDNAGLGLARSVSVVKGLLQDPRLAGLRILPMSGAQLIKTDETLADGSEQGDVKERRRIEIRLRKSA